VTLRLAQIVLPVLVTALIVVGPVSHAQENIIEVNVDFIQTESMREFLRDFRRDLQKPGSGRPGVVKEVRQNLKTIKQEHSKSVGVTKNFKKPVLVRKKNFRSSKEIVEQLESDQDLEIFFPENKIFQPQKTRSEEKPLNLRERQHRADSKNSSQGKILRTQNTSLGQLIMEMKTEPLKSHQAELTRFSEKITSLTGQLKEGGDVPRAVFIDLGNTYLESHQYLNALNPEIRLKLASYAGHSGITLGTHESALWFLKMALVRDPNDGETNFLLGKILSAMGEHDLALRRARNAEVLFVKNHQPDRAVQTLSFIESIKNSFPEN
jgi:hypothetical protein